MSEEELLAYLQGHNCAPLQQGSWPACHVYVQQDTHKMCAIKKGMPIHEAATVVGYCHELGVPVPDGHNGLSDYINSLS